MTNTNYQITSTATGPIEGSGIANAHQPYNPGQPSNLTTNVGTKTNRYFNNFFVKADAVSLQSNNAIVGYFEQQTGSKETAKVMAQAVLNTAAQQGDDPMHVLDEFRKMPQGELNGFLALYLNASRVNTSLLGISNVPQTNKYVARTILP